jgi:L-malate glycosyltransferase
MNGRRTINQIVPSLFHADAVGNQVVQARKVLLAAGFDSRVIAMDWDPRFDSICVKPEKYKSRPESTSLFHLCVGSPISDFALGLNERVIPYYHNVTPAEFYAPYNPNFATYLELGRAQLAQHARAPYALAASEYNRNEMLDAGYTRVDVLPYVIGLDQLLAEADAPATAAVSERLGYDCATWLFVGRIAPNKRQDQIIRAFNYYHRLINPQSRLLLVGGFDLASPAYADMLRSLVARLELQDSVEFCGSVAPEAGLAAYYRAADVFVCLSEHEGFCIPLVEAMHFDVPILALNRTGVPYALSDAGVLLNDSRIEAVAETAHILITDAALRAQIIQRQASRRMALSPEVARSRLNLIIAAMAAA